MSKMKMALTLVKPLDIYLNLLPEDTEFMFLKPRRPSKNFDINSPNEIIFENTKVGDNTIGRILPNLSEMLCLSKVYTNHSVRTTGIQILKRNGFADRDIIKNIRT